MRVGHRLPPEARADIRARGTTLEERKKLARQYGVQLRVIRYLVNTRDREEIHSTGVDGKHTHKLTPEQREEIRRRGGTPERNKALAAEFGITERNVRKLLVAPLPLTEDQRRDILDRGGTAEENRKLAAEYNLTAQQVRNLLRERRPEPLDRETLYRLRRAVGLPVELEESK